mmetsp:Transcript_2267/g.2980  ORF Transcript_2267/g.2980 Transcript_2267/m.2980 type:complete len:92 (+) Transcript_2267:60-335(+)
MSRNLSMKTDFEGWSNPQKSWPSLRLLSLATHIPGLPRSLLTGWGCDGRPVGPAAEGAGVAGGVGVAGSGRSLHVEPASLVREGVRKLEMA